MKTLRWSWLPCLLVVLGAGCVAPFELGGQQGEDFDDDTAESSDTGGQEDTDAAAEDGVFEGALGITAATDSCEGSVRFDDKGSGTGSCDWGKGGTWDLVFVGTRGGDAASGTLEGGTWSATYQGGALSGSVEGALAEQGAYTGSFEAAD